MKKSQFQAHQFPLLQIQMLTVYVNQLLSQYYLACHPLCLECGSDSEADCTACIGNANNDDDGLTCVCDLHYFYDEDQSPPICEACHPYCEDCLSYGDSNCESCKSEDEGIRDNAGTCECMIDAGFYETATDPVQCICMNESILCLMN